MHVHVADMPSAFHVTTSYKSTNGYTKAVLTYNWDPGAHELFSRQGGGPPTPWCIYVVRGVLAHAHVRNSTDTPCVFKSTVGETSVAKSSPVLSELNS